MLTPNIVPLLFETNDRFDCRSEVDSVPTKTNILVIFLAY